MTTLQEYISHPGINFSTLKYINTSPLHYQWAVNEGREDTTALLKFRAIHTAVLEPAVFDSRYVVFPGKKRQGENWNKFCIAHPGCEILKADERENILKAAKAVLNHPIAKYLLSEGEAERALTWFDPRTGLQCKARVDWWCRKWLLDLKAGPVNDRIFGALASKLLYYVQLAWYLDGLMAAMDLNYYPAVKFIVVEDKPPYDVGVFPMDEGQLQLGREVYYGWLDQVVECKKTGLWPGRYPQEQPLLLPKYAYVDDSIEDGTSQVVEEDTEEVA